MIITASQLRKEMKEAFPSLKSTFCEYVECLDDQYLVPSYEESLAIFQIFWNELKKIKWVSNIGDCDNRATILYSQVHLYRMERIDEIPEEDRIQWSFGFASGRNPFGNMHTFNVIRNDKGIFVFDNKIKEGTGYQPLSARF